MKKISPAVLILPIMLSCMLYSPLTLGEFDFPLNKAFTIPVDGNIIEIAVADDWIAVHTYKKITAIDMDTKEILWSLDFPVISWGEGFLMNNDVLIAASPEQIMVMNKLGEKKEINLHSDVKTITRILAVSSNYLFVLGGGWVVEAYDISNNTMLWRLNVDRGMGKLFYDPLTNVAYVTTDDSLRAFDNSSGELLWEMKGVSGQGIFFGRGVLYLPAASNLENAFRFTAIDAASQEKLWEEDIVRPPNYKVFEEMIIDNLYITSGNGMLAIDTTNGERVWTTPSVGEELYTVPIKFGEAIYVQGETGAVYAISPNDGTVIGYVRLEDIGFDSAGGGVYALKDGIVFSTRNEIVVYKAKLWSICGYI